MSRLLRGYRRLKKLFKVRDPSLSVRPAYRPFRSLSSPRAGDRRDHRATDFRARGGARSSVFFGAAEPRGACDGEGRESAYQRIGACAPIDSRARRLARETVRRAEEASRERERVRPVGREETPRPGSTRTRTRARIRAWDRTRARSARMTRLVRKNADALRGRARDGGSTSSRSPEGWRESIIAARSREEDGVL